MLQQPQHIKKPLYAHQLLSIKNMMKLEREMQVSVPPRIFSTKIGILSDLTGYGKTLSMLGLISRDPVWDLEGGIYTDSKRSGTDYLWQEEHEHYEKKNCNLVILNSILLSQWENEIKHTTLSYQKITNRKEADTADISDSKVLLCDSQCYHLLRSRFSRTAWRRIIVDEPNTVKISDSKMVGGFIWFITATPYVLLEKNKYLTLLGANPSFAMFGAIIIKNDDEFVKKSFEMPPNTVIRYRCRNMIYDILKGNIQKNIEDLAGADNISGLLEYLGASRESFSSVVDLIIKRKLTKLQEIEKLIEIKATDKLKTRYENLRDDIEKISCSFREKLAENNCPICLDPYREPSVVSCCQNIFCGKCITQLLFQNKDKSQLCKCPLCRQVIGIRNIICVNIEVEKPSPNKINVLYKTKSQTIIDIIVSNISGKYIIYSDYSDTFDTLKRYLSENNVKYTELRGVKSQREKSLENYRIGDVGVLLLTTLQYSAGIDLMNTTDIILYHDMSESTKIQIIGRANRIGRTIPLKIHCMF